MPHSSHDEHGHDSHDHPDHDHHDHGGAPEWLPHWIQHHWTAMTIGGAGLSLVVGFVGERLLGLPASAALACYLLAYTFGGIDVAREALPGLFRGKFDTDLLMLAAAAGAAVLGKWPEGAFLLFLFSLGHAAEHHALDRARHAVDALGELMPRKAMVKRGERLEETAVEQLAIGDLVVVRPGDRIATDGVVHAGASSVDQSAVTGESVPVARGPGDTVFAGTINLDRALEVGVTHLARDNTLARVMRLVAEARDNKSRSQRFAETFTRRFVPAVLVLTALVITIPPLAFHASWSESFYRAMLVLVAASPCALAIGTPAAVLAGIAQAARRGVLIKGGVHLENLGRLQTVAFDKTGTLTSGRFSVTAVNPIDGAGVDEILATAASVEDRSSHPLAQAIVAEARRRSLSFPSAEGMQNLSGRGVSARVGGAEVLIGALRAFEDDPAFSRDGHSVREAVSRLETDGQTAVIVRRAGAFLGVIGLADQPRPNVGNAILRLERQGVAHRVMLTGDNAAVAQRVAAATGMTDVRAGLLPENKLDAIRELQAAHGPVAMVGDGVNDAPALATATVGVAMGGAGTAVALETADVALMGDDLGKLAFAVGLSRATRRIITQNLVIALGVIGLLLAAALAGAIPLSVAVALHEGSTVAVALNALRLLAWNDGDERRPAPAV